MAKLTDGERKILNLAWPCFKEAPQIDYKKLAQVGGYKTPASATSVYLTAKKKVFENPTLPLTDGERSVLDKALHCVKSMPQVDYKKLQEKGGYKTPASATAVYLAARKKLLAGAGSDTAAKAGKKGKKGKKRKAAEVEEDDADVVDGEGKGKVDADADVTEEAAGKKPKKRAKKSAKKAVEEQDEEDAGLLDQKTDVKPKKRGKKDAMEEGTVEVELASKDVKEEEDHKLEGEDVYTSLFASTMESIEDPQDENT